MTDLSKTNQELIAEISDLKKRIRELENSEAGHKQAEEALREADERYTALFDRSLDLVYLHDFEGRFIDANAAALNRLGYTREEIHTLSFASLLSDDQLPLALQTVQEIRETGIHKSLVEFRLRHKDGTRVAVETQETAVMSNGTPVAIQAIARDITNRKQVEEKLRESEDRYRNLVENASDIVFKLDDTGRITFVNPAGLRIVGYEEKEIIGRHYPTFIRPDLQEEAMKFFGRQFVKGIPNTYSEYPVIVKDGREIWLGQNTQLIFHDGKVIAFQAVARDITDRKRIEQEKNTLADVGWIISSTPDIDEVYGRFAETVHKIIPFDRIVIDSIDVEMNMVTNAYIAGHEIADRKIGMSYPLEGSGNFEMVRTKSSLLIQTEDFDEYQDRFPLLLSTFQAGFRSIMNIPIFSKGEIIGGLLLRSLKPYAYTDHDVRLAEQVSNQIAGAIANARLFAGLKRTEQELKESEQRYRELSMVDDLTQLYNSRHFYFQLKIELDRSNRYEQPLTLLLLDLDNFKTFNDAYGHVEGDQVLRRLGKVVKRCLRETDFAYRYGGEEFTILLPMTTSKDGAVTAERIRTEFKKEVFSPLPGQEVHMTVSIGLAKYRPQEEMKVFVHRVDQLMYLGKKSGKDRVCSEPSLQAEFKG